MAKDTSGKSVRHLSSLGHNLLALLGIGLVAEKTEEKSRIMESVVLPDLLELTIASVLEAQAQEQAGAAWYERTQARTVYRGGHRVRRKLATPLGIVANIRVPRLVGQKLNLPWLGKKMTDFRGLAGLSSELFARGLSLHGIAQVSEALFGAQVSESTISRFNDELDRRYEAWRKQPIRKDIKYLYLDAIRLRIKRGKEKCIEGVLAAMGITQDGEKVMLGFVWGAWESTASWTSLLRHLESRGLNVQGIEICTVDGNPGLMAALRTSWPTVPVQRCWVHKQRNMTGACKNVNGGELAKDINQLRDAATPRDADEGLARFEKKWQDREPKVVQMLKKDWKHMTTYLRTPSHHWRFTQTTNHLERAFLEFRRKFNNITMMPNAQSAERLAYAQVDIVSKRWQGRQLNGWSVQ